MKNLMILLENQKILKVKHILLGKKDHFIIGNLKIIMKKLLMILLIMKKKHIMILIII